jgi:hypothetical protein
MGYKIYCAIWRENDTNHWKICKRDKRHARRVLASKSLGLLLKMWNIIFKKIYVNQWIFFLQKNQRFIVNNRNSIINFFSETSFSCLSDWVCLTLSNLNPGSTVSYSAVWVYPLSTRLQGWPVLACILHSTGSN